MGYKIINLREYPELVEECIEYYDQRWGLNRKIYEDQIRISLITEAEFPRFYLLMNGNEIIGSYSIVMNDFVSRQDLWPYISTVYVEEKERGKKLGSCMLEHGRKEITKMGYKKVYLCTDHVNYYEKYGWKCIGKGYHPWNRESSIYEAGGIT